MQILRSIAPLALVALLVAGCAGCGEDGNTDTTVNTNLKYKQNATYTYNMYQRDSNNTRISGNKNVVVWTVLQADASYQGKTGVTVIDEAIYDSAKTAVQSRDTIYLQTSAGDGGEVYQYDVVGEFFARVPAAASYRDSVPKSWSKIGDLKTSSATTWGTSPEVSVNNVQVMVGGTPVPINAFVRMNALHRGVVASTVPAGSFPKTYRTDHTVGVRATVFGATALNDSLAARYDFDIAAGLLRKSLDSRLLIFSALGQNLPQQVPGFEMELVAYTVPN